MFLLPCLVIGVLLALALGGKPSRILEVRFRLAAAVPAALALQLVIFSELGQGLAHDARRGLHIASYALLLVFAGANLRLLSLLPVLAGTGLNALVIVANGGRMPVSDSAAEAAAIGSGAQGSVSSTAERLYPLGDVFALPPSFPLGNVFSVGDLLIGAGMIAFVVARSLGTDQREGFFAARRLLQPFRSRPYRLLAGGRLISQVGDWLTLGALIGWIYEETHSPEHVAGLLVVRLAPPILGAGVAALIVDRLPKQRVVAAVEIARALAVAGALFGVLGQHRVIVIAAVAVSGLLAALSTATVPALVPSVVPSEHLAAANAGMSITKDIGMVLGGSGAGIALSFFGTAPALLVDLGTFVVATLFYLRLPAPAESAPRRRRGEDPSGIRYLLRRPRLFLLVVSFAGATLATGLTNASLPSFLGDHLGLGAGGYGFGLAALGGGLTVGGLVIGFMRVSDSAGRWIGLALAMMAGLFFVLGAEVHAPTALLLLAAIGFLDATTDVLFDTVIQREADPRYYGSVFGVASSLMMTTMVCGFLAAPVANRVLGAPEAVVTAGVVLGVSAAIAMFGMIRAADRPSAEAAYLLFLPTTAGYAMVERRGTPPERGCEIVESGRRFLVAKLARSPLPGPGIPCAYLYEQPAAS